jgi:hypothetical protein
MPPLIVTPLIKAAFGALGAAAVLHWVVKEVRRINDELDRAKKVPVVDDARPDTMPTLRRDPRSGDWRLM